MCTCVAIAPRGRTGSTISQTHGSGWPSSFLYDGLSERKTVLVRSKLRPYQPVYLGARAVDILHGPTSWVMDMRWTEWSTGFCRRMRSRNRDYPTERPLRAIRPAYSWGYYQRAANRYFSSSGPPAGSIRNRSGICAFSFPCSSDDAMPPSPRLVLSMDRQLVSSYSGGDKLLVAGNKHFACRHSRSPAASQQKGAPCLLA